MPELPEVETIVRALANGGREGPAITGRIIQTGEIYWPRSVAAPAPEQFLARLPGKRIASVKRRAKFIWLDLESESLLIHLRMSGDLRVLPADGAAPAVHDRLALDFEDGQRLVFNDPRKFGRVWLTEDPSSVLGGLGPEPFDPLLTAQTFHAMLSARSRQLKPLLMDQSFLAGLGNIYTDEALHLARLHPLKNSADLSITQAGDLLAAIRSVLEAGIQRNGASIDWMYRGGDFQNHFRAYGRTGLPCPVCGTPIQRMVVGQRGTHYCPVCQPFSSSALQAFAGGK